MKIFAVPACAVVFLYSIHHSFAGSQELKEGIELPPPAYESSVSIEKALFDRRSVRAYGEGAITLQELSQLLWAAQGITHHEGLRTAPSAGAVYPLTIYILAAKVDNLEKAVYRYVPDGHKLQKTAALRSMDDILAATPQIWIKEAPVIFIFSADFREITSRYGQQMGTMWTYMEAGHASQNLYLQAVSLDLGTVAVGPFDPEASRKLCGMNDYQNPIYLMPAGRKQE